ncbi:unnamed protein product [Meloidogyne enterolobii]|uniref:Uncharacterized protein n=1 Tax=Meloidogyne enterolobii TaxID=390850 RepID=A0ACB0XPR1_MELEN
MAFEINKIIFLLFLFVYCSISVENEMREDSTPLLWIFDDKGLLRKDSVIGTPIQFDGPIKVNPLLKEQNQQQLINVFVYEPFLLRKYFNISPSTPLRSGQSFKLILAQQLKQYMDVDYLNITLQAQLIENNNQTSQLRVEQKELQIKLIEEENKNNYEEEGKENNILIAKKDCNKIRLINIPQNIFKNTSSFKLFGLMAENFSTIFQENSSELIISFKNNSFECFPFNLKNNIQLFIENEGDFGISKQNVFKIIEEDEGGKGKKESLNYSFIKKQFNIQIISSKQQLPTISPPTTILISFIHPIIENKINLFEFFIEENEKNKNLKNFLEINRRSGAVIFKDLNVGIEELGKNEGGSIEFNVILKSISSSIIYDKALIILKLKEEKGGREGEVDNKNEIFYFFERPIYAFAVDPFNINNYFKGRKLLIGHLNYLNKTKIKENKNTNNYLKPKFVLSEGGEGFFNFEREGGGNSGMLIYNGPIGQFNRNYTLKVLLLSDHFIDSALIHVLIPGIGSSSPTFQMPFQRIIVHKYGKDIKNDEIITENNSLFTLSAEDSDPDARLIYELGLAECQTISGILMKEEEECFELFSLSPNGTTGQWILSLVEKEEENENKEKIELENNLGEALLNISVRDEAHPLESSGSTLVLLKFIQQNENQIINNSENINLNNNLTTKKEEYFPPILLKIKDSTPINSVIYSFGINNNKQKLFYFLSGLKNKYFFIDKENAILSVVFPLKNIGNSSQNLTIQIFNSLNSTLYTKIPFSIQIISEEKEKDFLNKENNNYFLKEEENLNKFGNLTKKLFLIKKEKEENEFIELPLNYQNTSNISFDYLYQTIINSTTTTSNNNNKLIQNVIPSLFFIQTENIDNNISTIFPFTFPSNFENKFNLNTNNISTTNTTPIPNISIIPLPENSPIGTYILSIDFNFPPSKPFIKSLSNSSISFGIERRTINSLVIRTNQSLLLKENQNKEEELLFPLNFALISIFENKEILLYKFSIQIISISNCQPLLNESQQLYFNLNEQELISSSQQLIPITSISANINLKAKGCQQINYYLELKNKEENILINLNNQTGLISISLLNNLKENNKQIFLICWAQSGIFISSKILLIIQINKNKIIKNNFKIPNNGGISPLILQINEGIEKGSLLTTIKNNGNNNYFIKEEEGEENKEKLIEINKNNGEIRTLREIDFEEFGEGNLPLRFLIINENNLDGEERNDGNLELLININNLFVYLKIISILKFRNDNNPIFERKYFNFVLERDIVYVGYIIGQINAFDKEINDQIIYSIISCNYSFSRLSRQINPPNKIFSLDSQNGIISLNSPVEDFSPGSLFSLELSAENLDGRKADFNSFAYIWIVESTNIISILVDKSPVELNNLKVLEYLKLLNEAISPLNLLLQEIRYKPVTDLDGIPARKSALLQTIFFNGTKLINYFEIEKIVKDLDIEGLIGFERVCCN